MNAAKYLAGRLRRTIHGPMWHGPAVMEALAALTPVEAAARPIARAHSAWEIVLHMAAWAELAATRLDGRALDAPSPEVEWPAAPGPGEASAEAWAAAHARLTAAYEALAAQALVLPVERLVAQVPGHEHSVAVMLDGVVEHGTYHSGQLALLKRAALAAPAAEPVVAADKGACTTSVDPCTEQQRKSHNDAPMETA